VKQLRPTPRIVTHVPFYYGWAVVGGVSATMFMSSTFAAPVFSIFIEPWTEEFGWSRTAIAGAFSFATVMAAMAGPLVGRSLDRYGGRVILGGGALVMAASLVSLGFVGSLLAFYAVFAVGRMAMMNIQNLASHTVIANWFIRRRGLATALTLNGNRVGMGVWPLVVGAVLALEGWRAAFWVLGGTVAMLSLIPLILVVARRPEEIGLAADGVLLTPPDEEGSAPKQPSERQWTARQAIKARPFWFLMLVHMAAMVGGGGIGVHRVPYFVGKGLDDSLVGPLLLAYAIGMSGGGFAAAGLGRFMNPRKVVAGFAIAAAIAAAMMLRVPGNWTAVLFSLIEGTVFGGMFTLLPVIYADYFGRLSIGTIRGLTHPMVVSANAVGPVYAGVIFDTRGVYDWAFLSFSLILLMGAVFAWFSRPPTPFIGASGHVDTPVPPVETGPVSGPV